MSDVLVQAAVRAIARRWRWLVVAALIAGAMAGVVAALQPGRYIAEVTVVPNRARFDAWMYDFPAAGGNAATAAATASVAAAAFAERRQTLAQLANNDDIERTVQSELGDKLPPNLRMPGALLGRVQGRVAAKGELIFIRIEAPTAPLAETIASSWSRAYQKKADDVFGPQNIAASGRVSDEHEVNLATMQAVPIIQPRRTASAIIVFGVLGFVLAGVTVGISGVLPSARHQSRWNGAGQSSAASVA